MLEIKTITNDAVEPFDREVNEALADGWELVERRVIEFNSGYILLYAGLEREVEPEEDEEDEDSVTWLVLSRRNIEKPYYCAKCHYATANPNIRDCPECGRHIVISTEATGR